MATRDEFTRSDGAMREDGGDAEVAHLRADIQQTRERLSHTVEDIGERLNPDRLKAQLKNNLKDATIGKAEHMARSAAHRVDDTRHNIMDNIRDNPIPAAMVGIGLGWLLLNGRRNNHSSFDSPGYWRADFDRGSRYARPLEGTDEWGYEGRGRDYAHTDFEGEGRIERAKDRVTEIAHDARDTVSDFADRAQEKLSDTASRARSSAHDLAHQTRYNTHRVEDRFGETMRESPLAVGAAAAAIGLAIGLSAPSTRREAELMGSARDELVDRAKRASREATSKVREVAERVAEDAQATAKEAAREQHLI